MKLKTFIFFQFIYFLFFTQIDANLVDTRDGKSYRTKSIGTQKWMAENLNTDRFLNGEKIQEVKTLEEWKFANNEMRPAWCYYNFDSLNGNIYGKLYNWYAVNDPRGLAPTGWKIPSLEDWKTLEKSVNSKYPYSTSTQLLLMSPSNWKSNMTGMGISGFNAQPSGYIESGFKELGEIAYFWTNKIDDIIFLRDESHYLFDSTVTFDDYWSFITRIDFRTIQTGSSHDGFEGDGFAVRCVKNETLLMEEGKVQFENKYFDNMNYIDTIPIRRFTQYINISTEDTTYFFDIDQGIQSKSTPFYISDHEVTNGEYREFINWVRDSIARIKIFKRTYLDEKSKWVKYVNFNSGKKDDNGKYYILNWDNKLDYNDPELMPLLTDIYVNQNERYYKRRELDVRLLVFDYYDEEGYKNRINVYPDTKCWNRLSPYNFMESLATHYFSNPGYSDYPVVGITFQQAIAYCIWRTMMYHYEAGRTSKKDYNPSLKFRLPKEEEWERAAMTYRIPNKKKDYLREVLNGYETNSKGEYEANFGRTNLSSGILLKHFQDDGHLYTCKVKSYEPNFNGIYCMYGNAAEWVDTKPELGDFYDDYFDYLGKNEFKPFRGKVYRGKDTSKTVIYITDPYTDSTFLVEKDSEKHKNLIQKRLEFYKVLPEDTYEDAKRKYIALNSINDSFRPKIDKLNNPKPLTTIDTTSIDKKGVIDGIKVSNQIPRRNGEYVEIYDIQSGNYHFKRVDKDLDDFSGHFKLSLDRYKQNSLALKRAENPFNRNYPNSNLQENCRLVKGGSWNDPPHYLLLNNSQVYHKDESSCLIGFRIAADAIGNEMNAYDKKRIKKFKKLGYFDYYKGLN